jgi:hypothetical protein
MYLCDSCGVRENREIKRKERVVHDSIARSASASAREKENARGRVSPELNKPDVNTVWRCAGFSHPTEKVECIWYMVTVGNKWCGDV